MSRETVGSSNMIVCGVSLMCGHVSFLSAGESSGC